MAYTYLITGATSDVGRALIDRLLTGAPDAMEQRRQALSGGPPQPWGGQATGKTTKSGSCFPKPAPYSSK